jgi:serine/threonine-protein kinase
MSNLAASEVRAQLDRILASDGFRDAGRLGGFLRFLVEKALAGESSVLKESVVGVEVFQRAADYDPRTDPIVRVEARRLRQRLEEYYQSRPGELRIDLPKGGYVPTFEPPAPETSAPGRAALRPRPHLSGPVLVGVMLVVIALGIAWLAYARSSAMRKPTPAVAVMPFRNLSADPANQVFSDGLTIELIDALAKVESLKVASWSSVVRYREQPPRLPVLRNELNAGAVLDGTVRKEGSRLRVTAQLSDTLNGQTIWSETYEREAKDVFRIQEDLAKAIVYGLKVQLRMDPARVLSAARTESSEAYELYLRARLRQNQFSFNGITESRELAQRALEADPKFAPAAALLASNFTLAGYYQAMPPGEAFARSKEAARKAIAIDSFSGEAHAALGNALAMGDWDWKGARAEFVRAIQLTPGSADVHAWYAINYLLPMNQLDDADAEIRRALEIDPASFFANFVAGFIAVCRGQFDEALQRYDRTIAIYGDFADLHWDRGMALAFAGRKAEALDSFRRACQVRRQMDWTPGPVDLALLGETAKARERLREKPERAIEWARAAALVGDLDRAMELLEQAFRERDTQLVYVKPDRRFANLRPDARFQDLLRRMGLDGPGR